MRTPEQIEALVPISDRSAQRFPRLRETQLDLVRRFANAEARRFSPGEKIYDVGDRGVPAWFLLEGTADLFGRDGLEQEIALQELDTGHFTGELHQLGDRPTLAGARAGADGCVALPLDASRLRALIVGSAELGELIMRAFILRRVGLLERGVGPVLLGRAGSAELLRLQAFLTRNGYPHLVLNCTSERGRQLLDDLALPPEDLPLLICACGRVLKRPSNEEASAWLGITPTLKTDTLYDVAVIGSGPAGLATAVYAASEGLSVLVVDGEVLGGQAGASARIENYLGFPTGISGLALTGRALNQAQKFGAEVAIPLVATRLECGDGGHAADDTVALTLSDQGSVRARAVVVASGARYKRPPIAIRGRQRSLLGVAGGGQALHQRGDRLGRRRQLGRPGRGVPRAARQAPDHDRQGRRVGGLDVALSDRPDQGAGECRYPGAIRDCRASWRSRWRPGERDGSQPRLRGDVEPAGASRLHVHRRRAEYGVAQWMRRAR